MDGPLLSLHYYNELKSWGNQIQRPLHSDLAIYPSQHGNICAHSSVSELLLNCLKVTFVVLIVWVQLYCL